MSRSELQTTLAELKSESKKIDNRDHDTAESINQLINKLEEQLSAPEISEKHTLIDHMRSVVEEFEYSHPRLTAIVNDLMVKLAGIGV